MAAKKKSARKPARKATKKSASKPVQKFMNKENVRRYGRLTGQIMMGAVRRMKTTTVKGGKAAAGRGGKVKRTAKRFAKAVGAELLETLERGADSGPGQDSTANRTLDAATGGSRGAGQAAKAGGKSVARKASGAAGGGQAASRTAGAR